MTFAMAALASLLIWAGPQSVLEGEAVKFSDAWGGKEVQELGKMMAQDGIRLHLPGEEHHLISPRQAQAALGTFLERYPAGEPHVTRVTLAGGEPARGFAEIQWETGSPGVSEPVIFTLFVAYAQLSESWSVTEIRVLY